MSAKNITTEKMSTSGFQSGGYTASQANGGGKHTPKRVIIDNVKETSASPKKGPGAFGGKESKNNNLYKG